MDIGYYTGVLMEVPRKTFRSHAVVLTDLAEELETARRRKGRSLSNGCTIQ